MNVLGFSAQLVCLTTRREISLKMSVSGCSRIRLCTPLQDWSAGMLCTCLVTLQMGVLDYYLIHHLGIFHLTWLAFDAVNITLLVISIHQVRTAIHQDKKGSDSRIKASGSMGWVAWLFISISVAAKSVFIFHFFSADLGESSDTFFGPNVLKTTIALGSCTFLLLLITQHTAPAGSDGRRYIELLTGSVVFDILDTVDILDVLIDSDDRGKLWNGLEELFLAIAVLNLLLPTVPLFTLAKSKFGQEKLSSNLIHGHRILHVLAVNMPNLLARLLLWHGFSTGVSPFTVKNILAISLVFYNVYENNKEDPQHQNGKEENYQSQNKPSEAERELVRSFRFSPKTPRLVHENISPTASESELESRAHVLNDFLSEGARYRDNGRSQNQHGGDSRRGAMMSSAGSGSGDDRDDNSQKSQTYVFVTSV